MRLDWTLVPFPSSFLLLDWDSVYIMGVLSCWEQVLEYWSCYEESRECDEEKVKFIASRTVDE